MPVRKKDFSGHKGKPIEEKRRHLELLPKFHPKLNLIQNMRPPPFFGINFYLEAFL